MAKRSLVALLALLIAVPVLLPTTAHGAPAEVFRMEREIAFAEYQSGDGCTWTKIQISGIESIVYDQGKPTHSLSVSAGITQLGCNNELLRSVSASDPSIHLDQFDVTKGLEGATLEATIPACDEVSGVCGEMVIDIAWAASSSPPQTREEHYEANRPDCRYRSDTVITERFAHTDGTLSFNGESFTLTAPANSSLQTEDTRITSKGCEEEEEG